MVIVIIFCLFRLKVVCLWRPKNRYCQWVMEIRTQNQSSVINEWCLFHLMLIHSVRFRRLSNLWIKMETPLHLPVICAIWLVTSTRPSQAMNKIYGEYCCFLFGNNSILMMFDFDCNISRAARHLIASTNAHWKMKVLPRSLRYFSLLTILMGITISMHTFWRRCSKIMQVSWLPRLFVHFIFGNWWILHDFCALEQMPIIWNCWAWTSSIIQLRCSANSTVVWAVQIYRSVKIYSNY